jgi:hypothetical protein
VKTVFKTMPSSTSPEPESEAEPNLVDSQLQDGVAMSPTQRQLATPDGPYQLPENPSRHQFVDSTPDVPLEIRIDPPEDEESPEEYNVDARVQRVLHHHETRAGDIYHVRLLSGHLDKVTRHFYLLTYSLHGYNEPYTLLATRQTP